MTNIRYELLHKSLLTGHRNGKGELYWGFVKDSSSFPFESQILLFPDYARQFLFTQLQEEQRILNAYDEEYHNNNSK